MKKLTVLFLMFLMTGFSFGVDYYISTQANFNLYRDATFSPGDNILFERGKVFTGMFYPNVLGTLGNVITISAYGTGDLPVINNNGVIHANGESAGLYLLNTGYVEVSNLEITNNNGGNQNNDDLFGILVREDDDNLHEHVYISDCYIHHINGQVAEKDRGGIHIYGSAAAYDDVRIVGNVIEFIGGVGIATNGDCPEKGHEFTGPGTRGCAWTNQYFAYNYIGDTGRNGMIIRDSDYAVVEYNTLANNSLYSSGHSIYNFNTYGMVMQYNEAYGNHGSGKDHGGFDADWNSGATIIQYNYSHDNEWFCGIMKKPNKDVIVRYNLSVNERRGAYYYGFESYTNIMNTKVYNNTHYFKASLSPEIMNDDRTPRETTFNNNIFYCEGSGTKGTNADNGIKVVYNTNVYYNITPPASESNPFTVDPLFVSPGDEPYDVDMEFGRDVLNGYRLSANSPYIDNGLMISDNGGLDFWGKPVPNGSTDIGASEHEFDCDASRVHNIMQGTYHCTIQAAIDDAATGDVIEVEQGTYDEAIEFNGTDITLTSTDPNNWYVVENTIIDAIGLPAPTHAIEFSGSETSNCLLTGLTITGGTFSGVRGNGTLAAITNCIIEGNETYTDGGGLLDCDGDISNCIVRNNNAVSGAGGGLSSCDGDIVNCLVYRNRAADGGGLNDCDGLIVNCTIVNNTEGGLYSCSNGASSNTFNCIVWGNTGSQWAGGVIPNYSCIENWTTGGVGNINTNPDFINPADNFRLQSSSLCRNAGNNSEIPAGVTGDLDEYIRIFRCIVDMGAYEAQDVFANPDGDVNCDDGVDMGDISVISQAWQSTLGEANYNTACDLYIDNTIGISDLTIIANLWLSDPSAPTVINADAANITFYSAMLNGEVTDNGGQDPTVTVYWGDENGGTTSGNWDNADVFGAQNSTFIDNLNSLSQGTRYYFRTYAANSGGSDWADSTAWFSTEALIAPTVIVSSATDITSSKATLNGEVTDIGIDYPLVTFYYGNDDAGEVAGSWDNSVSMGMRSLIFSTDIVGLAEEMPYYYRTFAENSAGSDWSDVTSFATASTTEIALDAVSSYSENTGDQDSLVLSWSHDPGTGNNRVVVVTVGTEGGDAFTGATFDGETMTRAVGSEQVQGNNVTEIFYILDADLPTEAGTYTVEVTMANAANVIGGAFSLENARQDQPEAVAGTHYEDISISQSITTITDGCWIIDVVGHGDKPTLEPTDSDQIERFERIEGTTAAAGSTRVVPTAGTVTNGWVTDYSSNKRMCLSMAAFAPITVDPIPPTVVNASATNITSDSARLNGEVTDNGYQNPTVTIYWGDNDGVTTPENWDHTDDTLGTQNSTFFDDVSSLSENTTYYFRAYASNSAGADWADSTESFTTPVPTVPTVVNASATNITNNSARLNGEVIDSGYEDPTVTVYWGESDGETTPVNWDHTDDTLGSQSSTFFDDVSSLSASTTYYFRAYAENSAGADWANTTESFTTRVISPPIVVTLPATSVASNSARLNGEVIYNGYEDPTVTVYWGESDGGMTPDNWDHTDDIGMQNSTFIHDVSSLSKSTTYYFRAYSSNSAGGDWAGSTESFTAGDAIIKINFQAGPNNSRGHAVTVTPEGYIGDIGLPYGLRNGQTYGWDQNIEADARGSGDYSDVRYDTLLHFAKGNPRTWGIALADGTYTIDLFCGDDDNTDSIHSIDVEGVLFEDTDGEDNFDEWLGVPVTVSDGKLTITAVEPPADNAKILFIHITVE